MQTTVNDVPGTAFEGMVAESLIKPDIISRKVQQAVATPHIPFGKMVIWDSGLGDAVDQIRLPDAAAEIALGFLQGIVIADTSKQNDPLLTWGAYKAGEIVPVMKKGMIWVICEQAITTLNAGVFVRHTTPGGSPPLASRGSFRVDADTANATQMPAGSAVWRSLTSAGGLALLEIHLP